MGNDGAVAKARRTASHFVLVTDHLDPETHPDSHILKEYRHQHIIEVHTGFRWLKGPVQVAPAFLKTPSRIAALGLVLILGLMVGNYVQFTVRAKLADAGETLPYDDRKRDTDSPTAEVVWELFLDLVLLIVTPPGAGPLLRLQGRSDAQMRVLEMLGLDKSVLTSRRSARGASG